MFADQVGREARPCCKMPTVDCFGPGGGDRVPCGGVVEEDKVELVGCVVGAVGLGAVGMSRAHGETMISVSFVFKALVNHP